MLLLNPYRTIWGLITACVWSLIQPFPTFLVRKHGYVWRCKERRKGFRLLFPLPSSLCDVSGHWDITAGISLSVFLAQLLPRKHGCLPAGISSGHFPYLTSPDRRPTSLLASKQPSVGTNTRINPQLLVSNINLLYDVRPSSKGVTTSLYGGTYNMAAFIPRWIFNNYYLMVLLLAHFPDEGSLSSCRKLIHTKTIPISTAYDSISYCLLQEATNSSIIN